MSHAGGEEACGSLHRRFCRSYYRHVESILSRNLLDKATQKSIIALTVHRAPLYFQTRSAAATGGAQSASRRCYGRVVPAKRILRSRRLGSGEVRDVAASASRGTTGKPSRSCVRLFQALLLPSSSRLRRERAARLAASQKGAKDRTQVDARSHGLCPTPTRRRAVPVMGRTWPADSAPISDHDSSAQYRPSMEASKKTPISAGCRRSEQGPDLTAAYEHLRGQVLGVITNCPRGPGLAVFLERGMKAWIEMYCRWKEQSSTHRYQEASQKPSGPQHQNEIVVLLTRMLLEHT
jgi:hypothetical protein